MSITEECDDCGKPSATDIHWSAKYTAKHGAGNGCECVECCAVCWGHCSPPPRSELRKRIAELETMHDQAAAMATRALERNEELVRERDAAKGDVDRLNAEADFAHETMLAGRDAWGARNRELIIEQDAARTEQAAAADRAQVIVSRADVRAAEAEARAGEAEAAVVQLRTVRLVVEERDEALAARHMAADCCSAVLAQSAREQSPAESDDQIVAATVAGSAMLTNELMKAGRERDAETAALHARIATLETDKVRLFLERDEARRMFEEEDREHDLSLRNLDACMTGRDAALARAATAERELDVANEEIEVVRRHKEEWIRSAAVLHTGNAALRAIVDRPKGQPCIWCHLAWGSHTEECPVPSALAAARRATTNEAERELATTSNERVCTTCGLTYTVFVLSDGRTPCNCAPAPKVPT